MQLSLGAADAATRRQQVHPFLGAADAATGRWQAKSREQGQPRGIRPIHLEALLDVRLFTCDKKAVHLYNLFVMLHQCIRQESASAGPTSRSALSLVHTLLSRKICRCNSASTSPICTQSCIPHCGLHHRCLAIQMHLAGELMHPYQPLHDPGPPRPQAADTATLYQVIISKSLPVCRNTCLLTIV